LKFFRLPSALGRGQLIKILMKKILLKIIYFVVVVFIVAASFLLIATVFPVTGNIKLMTVKSGSMEPAIKMGNIVATRPASNYEIGDIITYREFGEKKPSITHRIYEIESKNGQPLYTTKGDANESADSTKVPQKDVVGKVFLNIPYLGYVINFIRTPIGFILIVIIPTLAIILDEVKKIYIEIKKKKEKND